MPGFLDLSVIFSASDLIAALSRAAELRVLPCPFDILGLTVKQHWHARYHQDADCRWLRGFFRNYSRKVAVAQMKRAWIAIDFVAI